MEPACGLTSYDRRMAWRTSGAGVEPTPLSGNIRLNDMQSGDADKRGTWAIDDWTGVMTRKGFEEKARPADLADQRFCSSGCRLGLEAFERLASTPEAVGLKVVVFSRQNDADTRPEGSRWASSITGRKICYRRPLRPNGTDHAFDVKSVQPARLKRSSQAAICRVPRLRNPFVLAFSTCVALYQWL